MYRCWFHVSHKCQPVAIPGVVETSAVKVVRGIPLPGSNRSVTVFGPLPSVTEEVPVVNPYIIPTPQDSEDVNYTVLCKW